MNSALTQANELYRVGVAGAQGMSRSLQRSCLERAISIYNSELAKTFSVHSPTAIVSIHKNLGMTHFRLGQVLQPSSELNLKLIVYHLDEAVGSLSKAWLGQVPQMKEGDWGQRLQGSVASLFETAFKTLDQAAAADDEKLPKYQALDRFLEHFKEEEVHFFQTQYRLAKGNYLFKRGVKALEGADFKRTLQLVEYARDEIHSLLMFCSDNEQGDRKVALLEDMSSLEENLSFLAITCEAVRFRVQGDNMFDLYVNQTEDLNMETIWEVLDIYKASGLCCREKDIENEAVALTRQGRVYDKVFKIRTKAHEYYRAAFDLAQGLLPKDLSKLVWFKECKDALARFQEDVVREEQERWEKQKAPHLAKMTKVLMDLKDVHKLEDALKLLKHVYANHPPKCTFTWDEKLYTSATAKKHIQTAITYYHPDKQVNEDMEWRILCEEITKCLTVRYECFK